MNACLAGSVHITLSKPIAALQIRHIEGDREQLAFVSQLPKGAELRLCGSGFTARTRKVEWDSHFYFVFAQDIDELEFAHDLP